MFGMIRIADPKHPYSGYLPYLLFFTVLFVFFAFFGNYILFIQEKSSLFIFSKEYLALNLARPGSLLVYSGKLLASFFIFPVAGAVIVSLTLTLTAFLISRTLSVLTGNDSAFIPLMISALLFYLQASYQYLYYNSLGLFLQAALFFLTIRYFKVWLPVIIAPAWYFITGSFAWIYIVMYLLYLVFFVRGKAWITASATVLIMVLFIVISREFIFYHSARSLIIWPYSPDDIAGQQRLFIAAVLVIALLPAGAVLKIRLRIPKKIPPVVAKLAPSLLPLMLVIVMAFFKYDNKTRRHATVEKMFYEGRYNDIIAYNTKYPSNNILSLFLNNVALCETGRLNDMLFHFRQRPDGQTLFFKWEMLGEILKLGGYFYYTTGMINEAHRWAFENMVMKGHTPEGLKMLIRTELINGNYPMASKYIKLLRGTLFYRDEARAFDKLLFDDGAVLADPLLGPAKRDKLETDFFVFTDDPYYNLTRAVSSEKANRNALDYLLAYCMLTENFEVIAEKLPKLESYGFARIPVHLEEAAMAYSTMLQGRLPDTGSLLISNQTIVRFNQFLQTFQSFGNDRKSAEPALRQRFGNTFWYYAFYR